MLVALFSSSPTTFAQVGDYEGRLVAGVEVVLEGSPPDAAAQFEFQSLLKISPQSVYSAVLARQSLQDLFASDRVASARVEITEAQPGAGPIRVRFVIKRQIVISGVALIITPATGTPIAQDEIRARLNLLEPGRRYSEQAIERNADEIQAYLRDRGYYKATVEHIEEPDVSDTTGTRRRVIYTITPGEQSHVARFDINITGFDASAVASSLKLQPGAPFARDVLADDLNRIRQALINKGYLAPLLKDPRVEYNSQTNEISITLTGEIGPLVKVGFKNYTLKDKKARELLPVLREGNIDYSVIEEGARRVRNQLQEQGYFFADVEPTCTVTPPTAGTVDNGTDETCLNLNPTDLGGHTVNITYEVDPKRRLKLTEIRITGTNKLSVTDVQEELKSQKASTVGFLPFLGGYGRGFTSTTLLEEDRRTIKAHMQDLGYRRADVNVVQGISLTGDNLIITFNVTEGALIPTGYLISMRARAILTRKFNLQLTICQKLAETNRCASFSM